ncbi:MAG: rhodanese-like domain-containing protein [Chloroflexi bacterium]|nr:MAG: rhodanese-like domain-containing protein [Chloroflexota bacterium]
MPGGGSVILDVDRQRVRELMASGAQLVEVLPAEEYREEHLPGALHLPLERLDGPRAERLLRRDRPVVVYCFDHQ